MQISLVIRTLNEESNIEKCLMCINNQTLLPDEVLIIDNGSKDRTLAIIETMRLKVPLRILHNPVIGYSSGLNMGFQEAQYDYVTILSADCFPNEAWLENLALTLKKWNADCVCGVEILEESNMANYVIKTIHIAPSEDKKILFFNNTNILYKRDTVVSFLPFKGVGKKSGGEDTIMSIKFSKAKKTAVLSSKAVVIHNAYESLADFKKRTYDQGAQLFSLFAQYPTYPRIYLNPFYWSIIELLFWIRTKDKRFLQISVIRFLYTMKGIVRLNNV